MDAERAETRRCGSCSLCCTLLRVDALGKLGGTPCVHQRSAGGCGIHPTRPPVCRGYRCLWLAGALDEDDRPDRLGAVLDLVTHGLATHLVVREVTPGALDRSARLRAVAERFRASMPVRITDAADVLDPDHPFRELLPGGGERRVEGDRVLEWRDGRSRERRLPWLDRLARRLSLFVRRRRLRGMR